MSQPEIAKILKKLYFGGSRSFKVIDVDISKKLVKVLVIISRMFMYVSATVFMLDEAISVKLPLLKGTPFYARVRRPSRT